MSWFRPGVVLLKSDCLVCFQEERSRSEHNLLNIQKTHERMQTENKSRTLGLLVLINTVRLKRNLLLLFQRLRTTGQS